MNSCSVASELITKVSLKDKVGFGGVNSPCKYNCGNSCTHILFSYSITSPTCEYSGSCWLKQMAWYLHTHTQSVYTFFPINKHEDCGYISSWGLWGTAAKFKNVFFHTKLFLTSSKHTLACLVWVCGCVIFWQCQPSVSWVKMKMTLLYTVHPPLTTYLTGALM